MTFEPNITFPQHEIDAYAVSLEALVLARNLAERIPRGYGKYADQLKRAALGTVLGIAEGANRRTTLTSGTGSRSLAENVEKVRRSPRRRPFSGWCRTLTLTSYSFCSARSCWSDVDAVDPAVRLKGAKHRIEGLDSGRRDAGSRKVRVRDVEVWEVGSRDAGGREVGIGEVGIWEVGIRNVGNRGAGNRDVGESDQTVGGPQRGKVTQMASVPEMWHGPWDV